MMVMVQIYLCLAEMGLTVRTRKLLLKKHRQKITRTDVVNPLDINKLSSKRVCPFPLPLIRGIVFDPLSLVCVVFVDVLDFMARFTF